MINYQKINSEHHFSEIDGFTIKRYRQFCEFLREIDKYILDIGCNTGRGGQELKKLRKDIICFGFDIVLQRLNVAFDKYDGTFISNSTNIALREHSIDCILAGEFIEHLSYEDVQVSLIEFYRILKPNGLLIMTTPNPNFLRLKLTGKTILNEHHLSQHFPKQIEKQLKKIGFFDINFFGSGRVSNLIGKNMPLLFYGSYLISGKKKI